MVSSVNTVFVSWAQFPSICSLQAADDISHGRDALAQQGKSPSPKGKATLPKGTEALSEGRQEPGGPTSSGGTQPPVMLSHLANPKAADFRDNGFRDSLKKTMDAGRELGQPSLQQNSSSLAHSAQPLSRGSDTALRSVRVTARHTLYHRQHHRSHMQV